MTLWCPRAGVDGYDVPKCASRALTFAPASSIFHQPSSNLTPSSTPATSRCRHQKGHYWGSDTISRSLRWYIVLTALPWRYLRRSEPIPTRNEANPRPPAPPTRTRSSRCTSWRSAASAPSPRVPGGTPCPRHRRRRTRCPWIPGR
jgi:hypothetical protein